MGSEAKIPQSIASGGAPSPAGGRGGWLAAWRRCNSIINTRETSLLTGDFYILVVYTGVVLSAPATVVPALTNTTRISYV